MTRRELHRTEVKFTSPVSNLVVGDVSPPLQTPDSLLLQCDFNKLPVTSSSEGSGVCDSTTRVNVWRLPGDVLVGVREGEHRICCLLLVKLYRSYPNMKEGCVLGTFLILKVPRTHSSSCLLQLRYSLLLVRI